MSGGIDGPAAAPQALDFTKPIQTRDGKPVRILCTDGRNESHPIVGYLGDNTAISMWGVGGRWMNGDPGHPWDLINAPDVQVNWCGFDRSGAGISRTNRIDVAEGWEYHLRVTWTDGVPKADIFEAGEPE